jgi:hypothetical protein
MRNAGLRRRNGRLELTRLGDVDHDLAQCLPILEKSVCLADGRQIETSPIDERDDLPRFGKARGFAQDVAMMRFAM